MLARLSRPEMIPAPSILKTRPPTTRKEVPVLPARLPGVAHELRNCLNVLSGASQLLCSNPDPQTVQWVACALGRQIRTMKSLVNDLLDADRIARGDLELNLERLDLATLVHENCDDQHACFRAAGVQLHIELPESPVYVLCDRLRVWQVVTNLLQNAIKFTNPDGHVFVQVFVDPSHRAIVSIRDTGIGIDAQALPRVFQSFYQAQGHRGNGNGGLGIGLGLAIVKTLVELHGGQVQALSNGIGMGSEFVFWIPLAARVASDASS
jgi:signal transduction histidine kinase